jgi:hypothetical protein
LALELVSFEDNHSHTTNKPSISTENKDDKAKYSINMFLEQDITQQRDEMMDNFTQILQRLLIATRTSSSSVHFGGKTPFKV